MNSSFLHTHTHRVHIILNISCFFLSSALSSFLLKVFKGADRMNSGWKFGLCSHMQPTLGWRWWFHACVEVSIVSLEQQQQEGDTLWLIWVTLSHQVSGVTPRCDLPPTSLEENLSSSPPRLEKKTWSCCRHSSSWWKQTWPICRFPVRAEVCPPAADGSHDLPYTVCLNSSAMIGSCLWLTAEEFSPPWLLQDMHRSVFRRLRAEKKKKQSQLWEGQGFEIWKHIFGLWGVPLQTSGAEQRQDRSIKTQQVFLLGLIRGGNVSKVINSSKQAGSEWTKITATHNTHTSWFSNWLVFTGGLL